MGLLEKTRSEKGNAYVEAAIVLPVLFLFLFGIIQWGLIISAQVTLTNAVNATARSAAISGTTNAATLQSNVFNPMVSSALDTSRATLSVSTVPINGSNAYRVSATYSMPLVVSAVVPGANNSNYSFTAVATFQ